MKKTELYNDLSPELLKSTMLKRDQVVIYKLTGITKSPFSESGAEGYPSAKNVPPIDTIWDEKQQKYVDIAAVQSVDASGNHIFHQIFFYGQQAGRIILRGGNASDQEIHSYLQLCNYNASNPDRDQTKEAIFEVVNEEAVAEKATRTRNKRREALNAAADLTTEEVRDIAAALGKDDSKPVAVLKNELEMLADEDPERFLDLLTNKQVTMKAVVNRALSKGIIVFNAEQSRYEWPNKEAILTVARSTGSDAVDELVSFFASSTKGEKVYQTINGKAKKPANT